MSDDSTVARLDLLLLGALDCYAAEGDVELFHAAHTPQPRGRIFR